MDIANGLRGIRPRLSGHQRPLAKHALRADPQ